MNKHWVLSLAVAVTVSACGQPTDLAVRTMSGEGEQARPLTQLELRLLPYNRDSIFEALAQQAPSPEPQPPEGLTALRDSVAEAQERWREAEASWNDIRSELQQLSERMEGMNRASRDYAEAYRRFDSLDSQVRRLDQEKNRYFEQFEALQSRYAAQADSFSAVLSAWGDATFERYTEIVDSILEARGREELWDTTGADGWANLPVRRGHWWIHTRFRLPFQELYWNVPYQSTGGADTLILNSANAEERPVF